MSDDASKWTIHHEIFNQKGEKAAHVTVLGAWLDLNKRKLTTPPKELAKAFYDLEKGEAYTHKSKK